MALEVSFPDMVEVGADAEIVITLRNRGPDAASLVSLIAYSPDWVPPGLELSLTWNPASCGLKPSSEAQSCNVPRLDVGETIRATINFKAKEELFFSINPHSLAAGYNINADPSPAIAVHALTRIDPPPQPSPTPPPAASGGGGGALDWVTLLLVLVLVARCLAAYRFRRILTTLRPRELDTQIVPSVSSPRPWARPSMATESIRGVSPAP
jgi:hypothetical protein